MNKTKILYLILFVSFSFFASVFFKSARLKYLTKETGVKTMATIDALPECGKSSNTMEVFLEKKNFTVDIAKNDCIQGKYSIGDKIEVLYCYKCDMVVLPSSKTDFRYGLSIFFFVIPLYFLFLLLKSKTELDNR